MHLIWIVSIKYAITHTPLFPNDYHKIKYLLILNICAKYSYNFWNLINLVYFNDKQQSRLKLKKKKNTF